jgi:WD40 repeat protein
MRCCVAFVLTLFLQAAYSQPHLVFDHNIGSEWRDSNRWMNFVAISRDGATVAANGRTPENSGLGFWNFVDGTYLRSTAGGALAISADFRYLATEKSVVDLHTGRPICSNRALLHAAFSPDGTLVAASTSPNIVKGAQIAVLRVEDGSTASAFGTRYTSGFTFAPDGHTLASGHWNNVTLRDVRTGRQVALLRSPAPAAANDASRGGRYIYGLAFSRDGSQLAAGSDNGELQLWDIASHTVRHSMRIGWGYVSDPAFSPDGKLVAAGTYADGTVTLVDTHTGKILSKVQVSMFGCGSAAFSPDGRFLLTPSNDGRLNDGKHTRGGSVRVFRIEE